jgi:hypothetical protein
VIVERIVEVETRSPTQAVEKRPYFTNMPKGLGAQEQADNTHDAQAKVLCGKASGLFIQQNKIGAKLKRKRDGFSFAGVQIKAERIDKLAIRYWMSADPVGLSRLIVTGPLSAAAGQFINNSNSQMNMTE